MRNYSNSMTFTLFSIVVLPQPPNAINKSSKYNSGKIINLKHYMIMKNYLNLSLTILLISLSMTSCSTYQYSARQVDVNRRDLNSEQQIAGVNIDFTRRVTATSEYQITKGDAIREAEYKCIQANGIDVVVDPVYEVQYNPFKFKMRYKATIIGYAGMYEEKPAGVDATKSYTREEIENYKLLTDPSFPQYLYDKDKSGDTYYIKCGKTPASVKPSSNKKVDMPMFKRLKKKFKKNF